MKRSARMAAPIGLIVLLIVVALSATVGQGFIIRINKGIVAIATSIINTKGSIFYIAIGLLFLTVIAILAPKIGKRIFWERKKKIYLRSNMQKVDSMSGEEFELFLKAHLEKQGYRADTTKRSHDYGCDLILRRSGTVLVLQAKRNQADIGIKAVQEILGAKSYYRADKAIVASNRYFTKPAKELAKSSSIILWDRDEIKQIMYNNAATIPIEENRTEQDQDVQVSCPLCGSPMIQRNGKYGNFYGCSNYPLCKGTRK